MKQIVLPNIRHVACDEAVLLGAPVGEMSVDAVLSDKLAVLIIIIIII